MHTDHPIRTEHPQVAILVIKIRIHPHRTPINRSQVNNPTCLAQGLSLPSLTGGYPPQQPPYNPQQQPYNPQQQQQPSPYQSAYPPSNAAPPPAGNDRSNSLLRSSKLFLVIRY